MTTLGLVEKNLVPDSVIRFGIRRKVARRLREERAQAAGRTDAVGEFADELRQQPIALHTDEANRQHYEVPAEFFLHVLGPRLKYSGSVWGPDTPDLATAEEQTLALYAERAGVEDGQDLLDLGCGWGSLSLYLAERFPRSRVTGVSNSASQREFILGRARERGLENLRILTADMNEFDPGETFDRVLSIEMFEHMKNYERLLSRVHSWLRPGGKLFVHVFSHRDLAYAFEDRGPGDWMARHFFTGGLMPSHDLLARFQDHLRLETEWSIPGTHYRKTAEAWLANMDAGRDHILPVIQATYGREDARLWWGRWRIFFMACAELFGYEHGREWQISHYRFERP